MSLAVVLSVVLYYSTQIRLMSKLYDNDDDDDAVCRVSQKSKC